MTPYCSLIFKTTFQHKKLSFWAKISVFTPVQYVLLDPPKFDFR